MGNVKRTYGVKDNQIQEIEPDEADIALQSPNAFFGSHISLIPLQSAVQGPRLFYGARFFNQAVPLDKPEAALVQNAIDGDPEGRSYDEKYGASAGAIRARRGGKVTAVTPDAVELEDADGAHRADLYNNFPFNRKTSIHNTALVKPGDEVAPGALLAKSNYTDEKGTLAMGTNARVGLLPYKGYSMDDAIVISDAFAKRLASQHAYTHVQELDDNTKTGTDHFISLFPTAYKQDQIKTMDPDGVVKPGTVVNYGDPLLLATRPRAVSSTSATLGKLSKVMRQTRSDSSTQWDHEESGVVQDVAKTRDGYKVVVHSVAPTKKGDKIVFRSGQKGTVSLILPEGHMPRTTEGHPMEVLLNPLGIPSRANNSMVYELLLGKVAHKNGAAIKTPAFTAPGEKWHDIVQQHLDDAGLKETDELFDPQTGKMLENPVTTGHGYVLKLHHMAASKSSARGNASYDADEQPSRGSGDAAHAKRLSGLETHSLLSAGAYKTLREGATLRGARNDEYWRSLRQGYAPRPPGEPFVFKKYQTLLAGAGMHARKIDDHRMRLGPFTDKDLEDRQPVEVRHGETVNLHTMEPYDHGLFSPAMVAGNKWGKITMPFPLPNPAFEAPVRHLLGLTQKELREIIAGRMDLPEHLQ